MTETKVPTGTRGTAFKVLGYAWLAFAAFELWLWITSKVGVVEPIVAIATRLALGAGAIACARALRAGTLPIPPSLIGLGYAAITIAIGLLGFGLSVSPQSALGFLSLSGYSRAPNVYMPDVRQSMESGADLAGLILLAAPIVLFALALAAAATRRPTQGGS